MSVSHYLYVLLHHIVMQRMHFQVVHRVHLYLNCLRGKSLSSPSTTAICRALSPHSPLQTPTAAPLHHILHSARLAFSSRWVTDRFSRVLGVSLTWVHAWTSAETICVYLLHIQSANLKERPMRQTPTPVLILTTATELLRLGWKGISSTNILLATEEVLMCFSIHRAPAPWAVDPPNTTAIMLALLGSHQLVRS